jgi:hypothetical protein
MSNQEKRVKYIEVKAAPAKKKPKEKVNLLEDDIDEKTNKPDNPKAYKNTLERLADSEKRRPDDPSTIYADATEIREKLKNYNRIQSKDVINIPLGTRIKYVEVMPDGKYKYKPGGNIIVNKAPEYLVLTSNRKSWSVQLATHIIFVEHFETVRKEFETKIKTLTEELKNKQKVNENLMNRISYLVKLLEDNDIKYDKQNTNISTNVNSTKVKSKSLKFKKK